MKKTLIAILLCLPAIALGQGVMTPPETSFKVVNGITMPNAGATITVCAANAGGIPCSPALVSTIFSNTALTQPLTNPFTADATGGYQFAAAPGNYTVTETASGFVGKSYQITLTVPSSLAGGLQDPGANGLVFRNGLNTTRIAVSADVIALFSGTCDVTSFVRGDGACAPASPAFSGITSGLNNSATMQVGAGATLAPSGLGPIMNSATWNFNTDPAPSTGPTFTSSTPGGSFQFNHAFGVEIVLNNGALTTSVSGDTEAQLSTVGCASGSSCQITVTAPILPAGYTGYTVYAKETTNAQSFQRIAGCVNISTNCTFGSIPTTVSPPVASTILAPPTLAKSSVCPANVTPVWWLPDANGNLNANAYISEFFANPPGGSTGGPQAASSTGVLTFCRPVWFSDQQQDPPGGKNAFVVIDHTTNGVFNSTGNQERALWVNVQNPSADSAAHYGLEGIQAELDWNGTGTCCGNPDGELSTTSFQFSDNVTGTAAVTGGFGANVSRMTYFGGNPSGRINGNAKVINALMQANSATGFQGGTEWSVYSANWLNLNNGTNLFGAGFKCAFPALSQKFPAETCFYIPAATGTWTSPDPRFDTFLHNEWNQAPGLGWNFDGPIFPTVINNPVLQSMAVNASINETGGFQTSQIASNWVAQYSVACSGGASQYTYEFVAVDQNGGVSPGLPFNSGTACTNPLTVGNPATLNAGGAVQTSAVYGQAVRIDVYRTGGPMATGKIGTLTCNFNVPIYSCASFVDTGLSASGTVPTANTSGETASAGYLAAQANVVRVASDFTTAANTNLQTITGLVWNLDSSAKNYSFTCHVAYSQATANAAVAFGIQAATVAPTNIFAKGSLHTSATAFSDGVLATLSTTTATNIVSATPSATATNFVADLDGTIEEPANNQGQVINIMVSTATSGDAVTVKRGSYCYLY